MSTAKVPSGAFPKEGKAYLLAMRNEKCHSPSIDTLVALTIYIVEATFLLFCTEGLYA